MVKNVKLIITDDNGMIEINGQTNEVYIQRSILSNEMGVAINLHEVKKEIKGKKIIK